MSCSDLHAGGCGWTCWWWFHSSRPTLHYEVAGHTKLITLSLSILRSTAGARLGRARTIECCIRTSIPPSSLAPLYTNSPDELVTRTSTKDVGLLVVMIWLELCTTYSSSSPVVTTTSIILCFNKHWLTQVHLEKWLLKWREPVSTQYLIHLIHYHLFHLGYALGQDFRTGMPITRPPSRKMEQNLSQYQNVSILDFVGAKGDRGGGDNWSYKTCKAPVKLLPPTNQHPTFYGPDALPVAQPTVSMHWRKNETE